MRISITALTDRARKALLQDIKERKKAPLHERLLFDRLFNLVITWNNSGEPLSLVLTGRTRFTSRVRPESYREQFTKGFEELSCLEGIDYTYKYEEDF